MTTVLCVAGSIAGTSETDDVQGRTGGLFQRVYSSKFRDGTSWLGRQDSNRGMAESKSEQFASQINAHSENFAKFDPLLTNSLAQDSERRPP
jgi:hypothetical protein